MNKRLLRVFFVFSVFAAGFWAGRHYERTNRMTTVAERPFQIVDERQLGIIEVFPIEHDAIVPARLLADERRVADMVELGNIVVLTKDLPNNSIILIRKGWNEYNHMFRLGELDGGLPDPVGELQQFIVSQHKRGDRERERLDAEFEMWKRIGQQ